MDSMLLKVVELQNAKMEVVRNLVGKNCGEVVRRFPVFSIMSYGSELRVEINSKSWRSALCQLKNDSSKTSAAESKFLEIDKEQFRIFLTVKSILENACPILLELLGKDICAAVVCELGSLKRMAEISGSNLKGIGYMKNRFHAQSSYLYHHPTLSRAKTEKRTRALGELCRKVSKAAKLDYFNVPCTEDMRKKLFGTVNEPRGKATAKCIGLKRVGERNRRGGRRKRKKRQLAGKKVAQRLKRAKEDTQREGLCEDSTSTSGRGESTE